MANELFGELFDLGGGVDLFDLPSGGNLFGEASMSSTGVVMQYGSYSFSPVPILTKRKIFDRTDDQTIIGTTYTFELNGTLLSTTGGLNVLIEEKMRGLREAFDHDGKYFALICNGVTLLEGYPRIIGDIQFSPTNDNWTQTIDYTISLEFDNEPADENISGNGENSSLYPPYIRSFSEDWSVEFDGASNRYSFETSAGTDSNPYLMRLTHTLQAVGKRHYSGPGLVGALDMPAWQQARNYVNNYLTLDQQHLIATGTLGMPSGQFGFFDHLRSVRTNEAAGSYEVTETWAVINTGHGSIQRNALEEFNVEIRTGQQNDFDQVAINGRITGLETRTYNPFAITQTKFAAASGYWENIKDGLFIFPRAQALAASEGITLNSEPLIKVVGKDPNLGIINYSYDYDARPSNCIEGARRENIVIVDENPVDVFNEIVILGRPQGPILQSMNTVTSFRREVSIDVLMNNNTGCSITNYLSGNNPSSQVETLMCQFETDLNNRYDYVYKFRDSVSWLPKLGQYSRTVGWVATDCDDIPSTTFC